uniref:Uso1_p115_head domain-containing protein n=1 Tax=Syphacia muris TaxID=451379 RepID=A0A0N5AN21_9BILA
MSYFRGFFGGQSDSIRENDNGAEVVEKLVERVETSTVLEDRRDALKVLKTLAKKMRLPVAMIGMQAYIEILEKERTNLELISLTLDILVSVVQDEDIEEAVDELGERLSEILVRKKQFVSSVMALIDEYDFNVRRNVVLLLTALLRYRGNELQMAIMAEPMGVSKLVDLLHEKREAVRNNVVLMLSELSRANTQMQQLLAYENTFQLLFDIVELEPSESIVIEDCLYVMLNLLGKNSMNQQLFREASLIQRLTAVFHTFLYGGGEDDEVGWDEWPKQKVANVIFLLQVIRSLVSPVNNPQSNTYAAQKAINMSGMLAELCSVLLSVTGVTTDVLAEAIITVAEVIRGNFTNQEYFASRTLGSSLGNRSALLVLLMTMTAQNQALKLRCAVFYCFLSYLYDNNSGKTKIIDTLLPSASSEESSSTVTAGHCLCAAIMSSEGVQVWMSSVCLMHCLLDADHLKQQLLRVQLTTTTSSDPLPLLEHLGLLLVCFFFFFFLHVNKSL